MATSELLSDRLKGAGSRVPAIGASGYGRHVPEDERHAPRSEEGVGKWLLPCVASEERLAVIGARPAHVERGMGDVGVTEIDEAGEAERGRIDEDMLGTGVGVRRDEVDRQARDREDALGEGARDSRSVQTRGSRSMSSTAYSRPPRRRSSKAFYNDGHEECRSIRKVEPLRRALAGCART